MTMSNLLNKRSDIVVPTDDNLVRRQIRDLDEPASYFGEGPAERRQRLHELLGRLSPEARGQFQSKYETKQTVVETTQAQTFYYEGSEDLLEARHKIAEYSIKQANYRLDMARIKQLEPLTTRLISQQDLIERVRQLRDVGTDVDDILTSCSFNPTGDKLATSCRTGKCRIRSISSMRDRSNMEEKVIMIPTLQYRGHQTSANFITFSPRSGSADLSPSAANLTSCAMDGSISLWNLVNDRPVCDLSGPQSQWRVTRVRYHPSGSYLASCCSDHSWRLWDLEKQREILHQEGHSDAVFDMGFHPDGSLAGSAGMDYYARLWDLRTGRCLRLFEGHMGGIRTVNFSPDGYRMATGSLDNSVKVWNLRLGKLEYTIPAHLSAITSVMFEKENGYYLATCSFDKTVKFWSCLTWAPIRELDAYEDKITMLDLTMKSNYLATCHNKCVKLWSHNPTKATATDHANGMCE